MISLHAVYCKLRSDSRYETDFRPSTMTMRVPITALLVLALSVMLVGTVFADCSTMPSSSRQHGSPCCPEHSTPVPQDKSCPACISAAPVAPVNATLTEATNVGVALLDTT